MKSCLRLRKIQMKEQLGVENMNLKMLVVPSEMHEGSVSKLRLKTNKNTQPKAHSLLPVLQQCSLCNFWHYKGFVFKQKQKSNKTPPLSKWCNLHGMMCFDLSSAVASPVAIRTWCDSHCKEKRSYIYFWSH